MLTSSIILSIIFFSFIILSIYKFGLLDSYSAYAYKWKMNLVNIWSIITVCVSLCLVPLMIACGEGNIFQFTGFGAPAYLMFVGITSNYKFNKLDRIVHFSSAILCGIMCVLWTLLVMHQLMILLVSSLIFVIIGLIMKNWKTHYTIWIEFIVFISTFIILIIY